MNCHPACALEVQRQSDSGAGRTDGDGGAVPKAAAAVVTVVVIRDLVEFLVALYPKWDAEAKAGGTRGVPYRISSTIRGARILLEEIILKIRVILFSV